ncbi:uncharacterized protein VTP21DRAFT_10180 [Calcarisporiella thermophila]|uniref:uncharacterized protein n=1 Tax=Calcarisporiella thermophila TaxID=911321 RepID=UPI003742CC44
MSPIKRTHPAILFTAFLFALLVLNGTANGSSLGVRGFPGISMCIISCSSEAASNTGCSSFTNLACVCTDANFQSIASQCIQSNCPDEQQAAKSLQSQHCASYKQ